MRFGIDRLIDDNFAQLQGKRVGLFSNMSAVNRDLIPTYDVFRLSDKVNLRALFGPEHGFGGHALDGVAVDSVKDARTGVPIYSLYGANYRPTAEMLNGIDVLVCDIQDIGARFYTFLWTITHIVEACGEVGLPVMILDRPNPLGGRVDGGGLEPELASLVGRYDIPIQHGMTLGELILFINDRWNPTPAQVEVLTCDGWTRDMHWSELNRAFVPPSPAMAHAITALHYPGSCLLEGTQLSEGRGTALPFELVAAPYIDGFALAETLNALAMGGVRFRPMEITPGASKHAGVLCAGVQAHLTDTISYRPLLVWLNVIQTIRAMYPQSFEWLPPHNEGALQHFDRLIGDRQTRQQIDDNVPVTEITARWSVYQAQFIRDAHAYLLYEGQHYA